MSANEKDHAFLALDGLRGVAAISVMVHHYSTHILNIDKSFHTCLPNAFLAVDFFFVLSGFIIAYAYEKRLLAGQPVGRFMRRRFVRLYPLFWLGITIPLATVVVRMVIDCQPFSLSFFSISYLFSLFFLPTPPPLLTAHEYTPFPLNDPAWTLSLEIGINLLYALLCGWLTTSRLTMLVCLSAAGLAALIWFYGGPNVGWKWATYPAGWARVTFSFFAGVLLYRFFSPQKRAPLPAWIGAILALILVAIFVSWHVGRTYGFCCIMFFPLVVWVGARTAIWKPARFLYAWLGRTSYAIYIIHLPLLPILISLGRHLNIAGYESLQITVYALLSLGIVWALDAAYDTPVRAYLTRKLVRA